MTTTKMWVIIGSLVALGALGVILALTILSVKAQEREDSIFRGCLAVMEYYDATPEDRAYIYAGCKLWVKNNA